MPMTKVLTQGWWRYRSKTDQKKNIFEKLKQKPQSMRALQLL